MSPAVKYTLGRIGLFGAIVLILWPVQMDIFLKLIIALAFSAALSFFLLRRWRDEMAEQLATSSVRRKAEKDRLRAALAGEDTSDPGATSDKGAAVRPEAGGTTTGGPAENSGDRPTD
jgi:hypothetical protein